MSDQGNEEDELPTPAEIRQLFGATTSIKAQLKKARDYTMVKIDHVRIGKAYEIKGEKEAVFFVNALVLNPVSAVPMGMGFKATPTEYLPYTIDLALLGKEFTF